MSNSDTIKANFLARKVRLLKEKQENDRQSAEDIRDLTMEMRKSDLSKVEVDAINLVAKRTFEAATKREHRMSVEKEADELELFEAGVDREA